MTFTVQDLRYHPDQSYPALYLYIHRHAQQALGSLQFDAVELDIVIGHVVEQLVRLGILGGGDQTPLTAIDHLSTPQLYSFLNRVTRNKAIDRLRKRHHVSTFAEIESPEGSETETDPLHDIVEPIWGDPPFSTPEETALALAAQLELRDVLKHCIKELRTAPHQLQAVIKEMEEVGADTLLRSVLDELKTVPLPPDAPLVHISQHKDHAHKKLRHCLQQHSSHLIVVMALRLTEYGTRSTSDTFVVTISTLAQAGFSESDVRAGLKGLAAEGLLSWNDTDEVRFSAEQMKSLARFYREE